MESASPGHLRLGDRVDGVVTRGKGGRRFEVRSRHTPSGWRVELHTLRPDLIELGAGGSFWVAKIAPLHRSLLLHDGDFGRLPISDAMRPRYLKALQALLSDQPIDGGSLAEAISMVARIEQRNHADWLSVWQVLGQPETGDLKQMHALLRQMREVRTSDGVRLLQLQADLRVQYGEPLSIAVARLQSRQGDRETQ